MVYRGVLSKACQPCREKRRKCDLKQPQCSTCHRMGLKCFGYRDTKNLAIRDETSLIIQRSRDTKARQTKSARGKRRVHVTPSIWQASHTSTSDTTSDTSSSCLAIRNVSLATPSTDVAVSYFFTVYSQASPFAYLKEHLPILAEDQGVVEAICAPAMAAMALQYQSPKLIQAARSHYTTALSRTNKDLSHPRAALLDSTLLRVLLLSSFEAIAFRGRESPKTWNMHVQGAARLLALRQSKMKAETELGRKLSHHTCMNILIDCSLRQLPVPEALVRLQDQAVHSADMKSAPTSTTWIQDLEHIRPQQVSVMSRLATLRSSINKMLNTDAVAEYLDLDREASGMMGRLEQQSPVRIIDTATNSAELSEATGGLPVHTYKHTLYMYESQTVARLFNTLRLLRITVHEQIYRASQPARKMASTYHPIQNGRFCQWDEVQTQALMKATSLIEEMLASVPFTLELLKAPFGSAARSLIWPLATTANYKVCSSPAKLYIIDRLRALESIHGISQAGQAASMLEEGVPLEDWVHILHLS